MVSLDDFYLITNRNSTSKFNDRNACFIIVVCYGSYWFRIHIYKIKDKLGLFLYCRRNRERNTSRESVLNQYPRFTHPKAGLWQSRKGQRQKPLTFSSGSVL